MTVMTPKQARTECQRRTRATRIALQRRWPAIFAGPKKPKRPLARGIDKQIARAAPDLSRGDIRLALQDYTGGPSYLRACVADATRDAWRVAAQAELDFLRSLLPVESLS